MRNDTCDKNITNSTIDDENVTANGCKPEPSCPVLEDLCCCNNGFNIDSSLLFFFLILVCIFKNCGGLGGCGISCDTLLWFFLLLVVLLNKCCGCDICC